MINKTDNKIYIDMKKLFGSIAIVAIIAAASWNFNQSKNRVDLSDVTSANVEALASGEDEDNCKWERKKDNFGCVYHECVSDGSGDPCKCGTNI